MTYAELTDDELRLEVAKRCGWTDIISVDGEDWIGLPPNGNYDGMLSHFPDYPHDLTAAIALLESIGAEYNITKVTYDAPSPIYEVIIFGRNPVNGDDYVSTADTLPRAACVAWLEWMEAQG